MVKNKRAWIRIIEAFFSIMIVASVFIVFLTRESISEDIHSKIYYDEENLLRVIELNNSFRNKILKESYLPVNYNSFSTDLKDFIEDNIPEYLDCSAKICAINDDCLFDSNLDETIYSRSVGIFANESLYFPRKLKLFCWVD